MRRSMSVALTARRISPEYGRSLGAATGAAGAIEPGPGLAIAAPNAHAAPPIAMDLQICFMELAFYIAFLLWLARFGGRLQACIPSTQYDGARWPRQYERSMRRPRAPHDDPHGSSARPRLSALLHAK